MAKQGENVAGPISGDHRLPAVAMSEQPVHGRSGADDAELHRLVASLPECLWSAEIGETGQWAYRYVSPRVVTITGRPPEFFLEGPERWGSIVHSEDQPIWESAVARLRAGQSSQEEYRVVWPDGSTRRLRDVVSVSSDAAGPTFHLNGVLTDITEHAQAREGLLAHHRLLKAITEETTDAIFVKDLDGRYLMINAAGARFLGKSVQQVLGKDDTELFSPETAHAIMERDRCIMEAGQTQTLEDVGTAAGVTRTYLSTKGPYRDEHGHIIGLIGISRDITERKRAEESLRASEERYRILFEQDVAGVLRSTLDGRILDCNESFARILGYGSRGRS